MRFFRRSPQRDKVPAEEALSHGRSEKTPEAPPSTDIRYRALFENMNSGFVLFEAVRDESGRIVDFFLRDGNRWFEKTTGLVMAEVRDHRLTDVLPGIEEDPADWIGRYGRVIDTGEPTYFEQYSHRLDTHYSVRAYWAGHDQCAVTFNDITARKRAEQEKDRLLLAIGQSYELVLIASIDGVIHFVNNACLRFLQKDREEIIGQHMNLLETGVHEPFMADVLKDVATGQARALTTTHELDDRRITLKSTFSPVTIERSKVQYVVAVCRDISEEMAAAEHREDLEAQLRQAQKLEAIGRLTGSIAHDHNNMLGIMLGHAELMQLLTEPDHQLSMHIEEILKAGQRSASFTQQLLAFSRKQAISPVVISINDIVEGLQTLLEPMIGETVTLKFVAGEVTGKVFVDPAQIEQVAMNLVVNARDAMPDGGIILVETAMVELDKEYAEMHPEVEPGWYSVLSVSDSGVGIEPKILSEIFEPFFTTKPKGQGTGLGLSTVYGVVRQSGGHVRVYSEPGQGSTFKVYFPLTNKEPRPEADGPEPMLKVSGSVHVLLVEDEDALRKMFKLFLTSMGYRVTEAEDGPVALERILEEGLVPDIILTDVGLPGFSGKVLMDKLHQNGYTIPALYMSGYTDNAIVHQGILDEGIPFISKPFSLRELHARLTEILGERRTE